MSRFPWSQQMLVCLLGTAMLSGCNPTDTCEARVTGASVPTSPPFNVAFGTAEKAGDFLVIYLTRDGNACPTTWETSDTIDRDLAVIIVAVPLVNGSFTGTYALDPSGNYFQPDEADVWAGYLPAGSTLLASQTWDPLVGRTGLVKITRIVEGLELVGTLTVQFDTGPLIAIDFDVPFCGGTALGCAE